ncbi:MAG: TrkH family potassium uptake protein [Planctomycetota bacterium]
MCGVVSGGLFWFGRKAAGEMYRKEAMAVVGLSWVLATALGALPFFLGGVYRCSSVRLVGPNAAPLLFQFDSVRLRKQWEEVERLSDEEYAVVKAISEAGAFGLPPKILGKILPDTDAEQVLRELAKSRTDWRASIIFPNMESSGPPDRRGNYRFRWVKMGVADACFEAQSGFSTTGATVLANLEDPYLVPHSILFWRSTTHFLGGLGIIVLFVTLLGSGPSSKALMRAEMPGPTKEGSMPRMQQTAWLFAAVYVGLNIVLALILLVAGLSLFDALCHAFGTMATGGFSTHNASVGHFSQHPELYNSVLIEYAIIGFMILAGTNFALLYFSLKGEPGKLVADVEWRTYMGLIALATGGVVCFGLWHQDFGSLAVAGRHGLFQVVSIVTTTGYGTADFNSWNSFARVVLFVLMFVGGCAGSTGGGMKVIRYVLMIKILHQEIELAARPNVVRPLRLGTKVITDHGLRKNVLVYFGLIMFIFVLSWIFVVAFEPGNTWGETIENKLIDCASGVAATLNNIGPGLGIVGATKQYTAFSPVSKTLFLWLMMLGRLELFSILVLFSPRFWRSI